MLVGERATGFFLLTEGFGSIHEKIFEQKLEHEEIIRLILTCDIFAMTFSFATLYSWETTYDFSFFFVDVQMERNNHHPIRSTSMRSFFLFSTPSPTNISRRAVCQVSIRASE